MTKLCGVCHIRPARHVLVVGTFKRYKVVCGWCLWRELRKPGVKVRIGAGSLD